MTTEGNQDAAMFAANALQEFKSPRESSLKTGRAWALSERPRRYPTTDIPVRRAPLLDRSYLWASRCRLSR